MRDGSNGARESYAPESRKRRQSFTAAWRRLLVISLKPLTQIFGSIITGYFAAGAANAESSTLTFVFISVIFLVAVEKLSR